MKYIYSLLLLLMLFSCKESSEKRKSIALDYEVVNTTRLNEKKLKEYKYKTLTTGDDYCFGRLVEHFSQLKNGGEEILPYSKCLADNYDNPSACYYTYLAIMSYFTNTLTNDTSYLREVDENTKEMLLYYLEKGSKMNHFSCTKRLIEVYSEGYGVEKDLKKVDSLKARLEKIDKFW